MISAKDAVTYARSLIGTPYGSGAGQLDCINLIKKIIRDCPGGDPKYTTATTVSLWQSYKSSGRYKDLTERGKGIPANVKAGTLLFKGRESGAHQPSHVGIATGEGTVVHASSAAKYRAVVETPLNSQWTLWGIHKHISTEEGRALQADETGERVYYRAEVTTKIGKLNVRSGPSTDDDVIAKLSKGHVVDVMFKYPSGWCYIDDDGDQGYVLGSFLTPLPPSGAYPSEDGETLEDDQTARNSAKQTALRRADGVLIILDGEWVIDHIIGGDD